jgi:hypothetical protein
VSNVSDSSSSSSNNKMHFVSIIFHNNIGVYMEGIDGPAVSALGVRS